jgi:hypothetical protein
MMCLVGTVLPLAVFLPWLREHGLDLALLFQQATATPVAAFAWLDVLLSAAVVLLLAGLRIAEGRRGYWGVVFGTCLVGVSLGLPLYLYLSSDPMPRRDRA